MATNIDNDLMLIKAILDNDIYITEHLKFLPRNIVLYNMVEEELNENTHIIKIYAASPRRNKINDLIVDQDYWLEVTSNSYNVAVVADACEQIQALLDRTEISNVKTMYCTSIPSQISSPKGTLSYSIGFTIPTTRTAVKKKVI